MVIIDSGGTTIANNNASSQKKTRNILIFSMTMGVTMIILIASFLMAGENKYNRRIKMGARKAASMVGMVSDLSECTGHGVWTGSRCLCDLGWKGLACSEKASSVNFEVEAKSVLMVVDHFGPLDMEHENAVYYTTLATFLAKSRYKVTVLQTTPPTHQWDALVNLYKGRGVTLMGIPSLGIQWENGPEERVSYELYRWLNERDGPDYEHIFFLTSSGAGFYTIQAQRQGLTCLGSHFLVAIDGLTEVRMEQIRKGLNPKSPHMAPESSLLIFDRGMLTREWMLQKSAEMADTVIANTKVLLDSVVDQGWKIPDNVYILPYLTVPVAANDKSGGEWERADELIPSRQALVREFVFVGRLGTAYGLQLFLNAIDNVLSRDQKAHRKYLKGRPLKVTFWGPNDLVGDEDDMTGEHFIESRAFGWGQRVKYLVRSQDSNMKRLVRYLTEPGKGRVAIVPSLIDSSAFFVHQALRAGVPVMASNVRSVQEIVHIQDRREVLFATNDTVALARKMLDAWNNGVLLGRPHVGLKQYERQWAQLMADLNDRPAVHCPVVNLPIRGSIDDTPLVSVVITHHNRHRLLAQLIDGLEKQTYRDFEVILVDDGSTDPDSLNYLADLAWKWWQERGWKVLREPNRYVGAARNTGAKHARGKYVLFIDDDDLPKSNQLEVMLRVAELTGADIVTTGHDLFEGQNPVKSTSLTNRYIPLGPAINLGLIFNCFGDSSILVHREYFIEAGGFTEEYGVGFEDYEFLAKAAVRENHIEAIGEPLRWYRQHPSTMSHVTNLRDGQLRFLRAYMEMFTYLQARTQALVRFSQKAFLSYTSPRAKEAKEAKQITTSFPPFSTTGTGFTFSPITFTFIPTTLIATNSTTTTSTISTSTSTTEFITITTPTTSTTTTTTTTSSSTTTSTTTSTTSTTTTTTTTSTTTTSTTTTSTTSTTTTSTTTTTSSTTTTTTSSTTTTTTPSGTSTCPCRARRKVRSTSTTPKRPTCYKTETVTPTLYRTAKPQIVTSTRTPTVTYLVTNCEENEVRHPRMEKMMTMMNPMEEVILGDDNVYTTITKVWLDAPPPIPPRALQAQYDSAGEHISILFDRPLNVETGRRTPCAAYFLTNPDIKNGAHLPEEDCEATFVSPVEMRIRVAAKWLHRNRNKSVQPGRLLQFRERTLRNLDSLNHAWVSGSVEVGWPEHPIQPHVKVLGPAMISAADGWIRFDFSQSSGSAGRPWIDAHFDFVSSAVELAPILEAPLQGALNQAAARVIKTGRLAFELPASLLHEYTSYTFRFTLWNVFGSYATTSHIISKLGGHSAAAMPAITIDGPSGSVLRSEPVRLLAVLPERLPDGSRYNATMVWSMVASPRPMRLRGATKPALIFDRFSLAPGTYIISLRLTISTNSDDRKQDSVSTLVQQHSFKVVNGPWDVEIVGGSRKVGALDNVQLGARIVDLAPLAGQQSLETSDYEWSWSCASGLERAAPCLTRDGFMVEIGSTKPSITLPIGNLPGGKDIVISVTAKQKSTNISRTDYIILEIAAAPNVPTVLVDASSSRPATAANEELTLSARFTPVLKQQITIMDTLSLSKDLVQGQASTYHVKWESMSFCAGRYYATLPLLNQVTRFKVTTDDVLEDRHTLMASVLIPGAHYCFRATVQAEDGQQGWAFTIVKVKAAPSSGYCELESPAIGRAFESLFSVACHGWTADPSTSGSLRYRFYRRTKKDSVPLAPGSRKSRIAVPLDVGHAMIEAHISDEHGVTTVVPVRAVSARLSNTTREDFMLDRLQSIDATGNIELGYQVLALAGENTVKAYQMASGQAAMLKRRNTTEPTNPLSVQTLTRLLHLLDVLTQNTYLDAIDSGPFFLHSLLRIVPPKLPIDLRPVMLRILHRIAVGMARDRRPEGRCFDTRHAISILHALTPVLENPRSGASASFVVHEIKTVVETCLQREMSCSSEPFRLSTPRMDIELGMVESGDTERLGSLCGFGVPSLLGISPESTCLGYRCSILKSNLMRNGSIDTNVHELTFRNSTMVLAPTFRSKRSINFTIPLTRDFFNRVMKGGVPVCVWYERDANATVSRWSSEGCVVTGYNRWNVNCSCTHLTEFSILILSNKRPLKLTARYWLLVALLSTIALLTGFALWSMKKKHQYDMDIKSGKREYSRRFYGPPTYEQHVMRRKWRFRDSDQSTLLAADQQTADSSTKAGSSTLAAPSNDKFRTVSMVSTLYDYDDDPTAVEDSEEEFSAERFVEKRPQKALILDEPNLAIDDTTRLAPAQMRPYSHLHDETIPQVAKQGKRFSMDQETKQSEQRRLSNPNESKTEEGNIFEDPPQGRRTSRRRGTIFNLLNNRPKQ